MIDIIPRQNNETALVRMLDTCEYEPIINAMRDFTEKREDNTRDEIWILEHPAVFTMGKHGKDEHIIDTQNIPLVHTDRGGQVTYHGPGQVVIYFLLDLKRKKMGVKKFVHLIEHVLIKTLQEYDISAQCKKDAPGIYIDEAKVASIGLRVKKGCTYHGLSINVDMDLIPFTFINPCGFENLPITQITEYDYSIDKHFIISSFLTHFLSAMGYEGHTILRSLKEEV